MDIRRWRQLLADPRAVDAALVLACLFLTVLAVKTPWSVLPRPVIAVVGVLGSLVQWRRRRQPGVAAVAGAVASAVGGNPGPLLVGLYSGASYGPRRHRWAVVVVGWAGFAGWWWLDEGRLYAGDAMWAAVATAVVAGVGVYTATRRALAESWRERAEHAESERRLREEQARSAERTRIAREMHDVLAHKVSLIALHAGALELAVGDGSPKVQQGAALIRVTAREALQELRQVLGLLQNASTGPSASSPPSAPDDPFADLASLVEVSTRAGQRVEFDDRAGPLPPATARVVYRIAQEALTNARKHAPDALAFIAVHRGDDGAVTVTVRNAASGIAPMDLPGSGSGLVGLSERVRLVGGTIHSGPAGDGWELRAVIPRPDPSMAEDGR
jgi:signal transduction histidine kinase